jgi:hypothetical protein
LKDCSESRSVGDGANRQIGMLRINVATVGLFAGRSSNHKFANDETMRCGDCRLVRRLNVAVVGFLHLLTSFSSSMCSASR